MSRRRSTADGTGSRTHREKSHGPLGVAHLLPPYDEYLIAYKDRSADRSAALDPAPWDRLATRDPYVAPIVLDGRVVGGWKRAVEGGTVAITLDIPGRLSRVDDRLVQEAARRYGAWLGLDVALTPR